MTSYGVAFVCSNFDFEFVVLIKQNIYHQDDLTAGSDLIQWLGFRYFKDISNLISLPEAIRRLRDRFILLEKITFVYISLWLKM